MQPVPKFQPVTMPLVNSSCDGVETPIVVWLQLNFELLERQSTGKRHFVVLVVQYHCVMIMVTYFLCRLIFIHIFTQPNDEQYISLERQSTVEALCELLSLQFYFCL